MALVDRYQLASRTELVLHASLQREPHNPADSDAVAVIVEGEKVGYLPSYAAKLLPIGVHGSRAATVQIFCLRDGVKTRVEAWAWLEEGEPKWVYSQNAIPPLSSEEKRMSEHAGHREMVADAISGGGQRAAQFKTGMVQGIHYLEAIEPIKQFKREGKLREALNLCYLAIEGAENARDGMAPAPWYTEQAAIIHRKLGQKDEEIAVLERWLKAAPAKYREPSRISERLSKLKL